jgi:hypothetical protein
VNFKEREFNSSDTSNIMGEFSILSIETWHVVQVDSLVFWNSDRLDFIIEISERLILTDSGRYTFVVTFRIDDNTGFNILWSRDFTSFS